MISKKYTKGQGIYISAIRLLVGEEMSVIGVVVVVVVGRIVSWR